MAASARRRNAQQKAGGAKVAEGFERQETHDAGATDKRYADMESRLAIYQGITAYQLGQMFGMQTAQVLRRLERTPSTGLNARGQPIWRIPEAAPLLLDMDPTIEQINEYMARVNPGDLPPKLNKAYWEAMASKLRYGERASELWTTTEVVETAASAFQSLAFSLRLLADDLRDETGLSETQFKRAQETIDAALERAYDDLGPNLRKSEEARSRSTAEEGAVSVDC